MVGWLVVKLGLQESRLDEQRILNTVLQIMDQIGTSGTHARTYFPTSLLCSPQRCLSPKSSWPVSWEGTSLSMSVSLLVSLQHWYSVPKYMVYITYPRPIQLGQALPPPGFFHPAITSFDAMPAPTFSSTPPSAHG